MTVFIHGDDDFLVNRLKKSIREKAAREGRECDFFAADERPAAEIADAAANGSLFASQKTVFIDRLDEASKKDLDVLAERLVPPPEGVEVVFLWRRRIKRSERPPAAVKKIMEIAEITEIRPMNAAQLADWAKREAEKLGAELSPEAAEMLARETGGDAGVLMRELEKCCLAAAGKKGAITAGDAATQLFSKAAGGIFAFASALEKKNAKSAMEQLDALLESGQEPLVALDRFHRTFLRIYRYKILSAEGKSRDELAGMLALNNYFDRDFFRDAGGHTASKAAKALTMAAKCNLRLKRLETSGERKTALEMTVAESLDERNSGRGARD